MKLIFAIKALHDIKGGAERVFCETTTGLAESGHDVTAVSFDAIGAEPFYPLGSAVTHKPLAVGDVQHKSTIREFFARVKALRALMRKEKPDAVVAFMHSMVVPAAVAAIGLGVPVIGSEHIVPAHYRTRRLEYLLFLIASLLVAKITVVSDSVRSTYPWIIRRKMTAIANPVQAAGKTASPSESRIVLNVGRLDPQKDQATLIHAFARIADRFPLWRVRVVGDGVLRDDLSALVQRLGLHDRVDLVPAKVDIRPEYGAAAIFALPSKYESFGMAMAEAMLHGLPVVGFHACDGTRELILDGVNGILIHDQDRIAALACALESLMADSERRNEMGGHGKAMAAAYTLDRTISSWKKLLAQVRQNGSAENVDTF